jgi:hypothetical protein
MGNVAVTPGFARAIAGTGAVFVVFLIPHILAGLTAIRGPRDLPVFASACSPSRWPARDGMLAGIREHETREHETGEHKPTSSP